MHVRACVLQSARFALHSILKISSNVGDDDNATDNQMNGRRRQQAAWDAVRLRKGRGVYVYINGRPGGNGAVLPFRVFCLLLHHIILALRCEYELCDVVNSRFNAERPRSFFDAGLFSCCSVTEQNLLD